MLIAQVWQIGSRVSALRSLHFDSNCCYVDSVHHGLLCGSFDVVFLLQILLATLKVGEVLFNASCNEQVFSLNPEKCLA